MDSNNAQKALNRVIAYCESIVRLEGSPSDEAIEVCEKIMGIIRNKE